MYNAKKTIYVPVADLVETLCQSTLEAKDPREMLIGRLVGREDGPSNAPPAAR